MWYNYYGDNMNIIDIIEKKRNSEVLNYDELNFAFNGYLKGKIADYQMSSLLMTIMFNSLSDNEILDLTKIFIKSGKTVDFNKYGICVDKHSTGGVGDKVTLIIGPILASAGLKFPKMSGRGLGYTGGTIDKLESIPNIKLSLTKSEMINSIKNVGMFISSQSSDYVPMDKAIYALRSACGCVSSVPLIAVSIMSKKIAYGSKIIFIDIKCGSGALIKNKEEAKELSRVMKLIAKNYDVKVIIEISDMNTPLGSNIGNSLEVIEALDVLNGKTGPLTDLCKNISSEIIKTAKNISKKEAMNEVNELIKNKSALNKFYEFVNAQGGKLAKIKISRNIKTIYSNKKGVIKEINALEIAKLSFSLGAGRLEKNDKIDYSVGVVLKCHIGDNITINTPLMDIYYNKKYDIQDINTYFVIAGE